MAKIEVPVREVIPVTIPVKPMVVIPKGVMPVQAPEQNTSINVWEWLKNFGNLWKLLKIIFDIIKYSYYRIKEDFVLFKGEPK